MNRGGVQRAQLVGVIPLAAIAEVVIHLDEPSLLQLLDSAAHGAVGNTAGFGDGPPAGVAAVCFVVAAEQITVDGEGYRRQLIVKDFSWEHDERLLFHFPVPPFGVK
jgi:hypothetical protein